jgi:hypothetical protein
VKQDSIQATGAAVDRAVRSPDWLRGLDSRDWFLDGHPIRGAVMKEMFEELDWSQAWVDLGPSVAGNLGPYWHVPLRGADTVHRLYPKVLGSKWIWIIRQACTDYARLEVERSKHNEFPPQVIATPSPQSREVA